MRGRNLRRTLVAAGLVAASAVLVLILALGGLLAFIVASAGVSSSWNASVADLSAALTETEDGYTFTAADYLAEKELWAMLIDENGDVVWQQGKPDDVPNHYTLTDVASFTRWYLNDYPVQVRIRPDGLLVAGSPKGSTWKHPFILDTEVLATVPLWFAGLFLLALLCVLGLTALVLSRQFRREQRERDTARSDWINGVSHDIRTPLSMVMGYAAQMEGAADLPPERRRQAGIIRAQSQAIRDLVNDLKTFGFLFETLCVRDLRVFADALNGEVYHYRDKEGQECDAVIHLRNGRYGLIEIKLGGDRLIEEGARSLKALEEKIDTDKMYAPSFLMVLTGTGDFAYRRKDGVYVIPIGCLKN